MTFCCQVFLNTFVYQCYKLVSFVSFSIGRRFSSFWCYSWLILSSFLRYYDLQDNPHSYFYSFQVQAKKFCNLWCQYKKDKPIIVSLWLPLDNKNTKKEDVRGFKWIMGARFFFSICWWEQWMVRMGMMYWIWKHRFELGEAVMVGMD